jgi:transcriptional regulator
LLRQEGAEVRDSADVIQGTLDMLILQALSVEALHGWGISERIQRMSGDVFRVGQGSLYPALHRFDNRGWVTSYWRTTKNNRIARYYELTAAGRHALSGEIARWRAYTGAVDAVIAAAHQPSIS